MQKTLRSSIPIPRLVLMLFVLLLSASLSSSVTSVAAPSSPYTAQTRVSIQDGKWLLNGEPLYRGTKAEGLLMNVRMVNAIFEDARRKDFDPESNTAEFLAQIPAYRACGVRAFTLCLQGGMPGYEGAVNSAFNPDGSLRAEYLARARRVIEACDREGIAVILGCYYQRQCKILKDDAAIRAGVAGVARWIRQCGFANVMLEVANEYPHTGFAARPLLRSPKGEAELIRLAQKTAPGLLVASSGYGDGRLDPAVAEAGDFLLIHLNGVKPEKIAPLIPPLRKYHKPVVCNEDADDGAAGARSAENCVALGVSWGFMTESFNQHFPFNFKGAADDPIVYAKLKELTTPAGRGETKASAKATDKDAAYFPPPDAQGGWRTLQAADEIRRVAGMDCAKLDTAYNFAASSTKNGGLLVLRRGWLVYERYFGLGSREATPNLASCGKPFTSIATGILMAEHPDLFPAGLDQKIFTHAYLPAAAFPLSDPAMAGIKLGQLLSFSAGIRGNNPSYVSGKEVTIDPAGPDGSRSMADDVALGKSGYTQNGKPISAATLWCPPGGGYSYASASIHIASIIVRHVSGMELEEYVRRHLAEPLGWGRWGYGYKSSKSVTHTPGGGGIVLRATDMLRFGYLLLRQGRWAGRQVVPADYVRRCGQASPYNPHFPYSLQFNVNSGGEIPELPRDAFWKMGSGGHVLYVVPSLDLVVWKLGGRDGQYDPRDTGQPLPPEAAAAAESRKDWKPALGDDAAARQVLAAVVAAMISEQPAN